MKNKTNKISICSRTFFKNKTLKNLFASKIRNVIFNKSSKTLYGKELVNFIKNSEIIIVGLETLNKKILSQASNLKIVIKYGVGLDKIDLPELKKRKIKLIHFPGFNKRSVAELVLGYMLEKSRNLSFHFNNTVKKKWETLSGVNLSKKIIGIIGYGNVGQDLCKILSPFRCTILINDLKNKSTFKRKKNIQFVSKKQIFKQSDFISIHIPYNKKNKNLINYKFLKLMKSESTLINTSRGGIVDEKDLKTFLKKHQSISAYFDVLLNEPILDKNKLISLKNFHLTPHIGGSTNESIINGGKLCLKALLKIINEN